MEPNTQPNTPANNSPESAPLANTTSPLSSSVTGPSVNTNDAPVPAVNRIVVQPSVQSQNAPITLSNAPASETQVSGTAMPTASPRLAEHGQTFGHRVITPSGLLPPSRPSVADDQPNQPVGSSIPASGSSTPVVTIGGPGDPSPAPRSSFGSNYHPNPYPTAVSGVAADSVSNGMPLNAVSAMSPTSAAPKKRRKKILLASIIGVVVLGGGAAAFYFGYYANPSVIYAQSLKNTGKGYDKLVEYATAQSQIKYKSVAATGNFSFKSGSFSTDGTLAYKGDGNNGDLTFNVGDGIGRLDADIRAIKSTTATPDLYVKVNGLTDLGSLFGTSPELNTTLNKLNNNWISIDHTTLDNLQNSVSAAAGTGSASTAATPMAPSEAQITDELKAFGQVNQQYLFSTDKNKAVTTVVKNYGMETIDGHKTYHYQVALDKPNVKDYITAQQKALQASQLGSWLKQNNYDGGVQVAFDAMQQSADTIKPSDTFDLWADVNQRVVYKVRLSDPSNNPAENYIDVGLNYKGGDNYPFFISGQSKSGDQTTTGSLIATLNTKTHSVGLKLNLVNSGAAGGTLTGNFNFQPSNASVQIDKPAGAVTLTQVLNELGLGDLLNGSPTASPLDSTGTTGILNGLQSQTITQ